MSDQFNLDVQNIKYIIGQILDDRDEICKGNKAAMQRWRVRSLELEKAFHKFRRDSMVFCNRKVK